MSTNSGDARGYPVPASATEPPISDERSPSVLDDPTVGEFATDRDVDPAAGPNGVHDTRLPQGTAPEGIAHTKTAALWTGLVVGAIILVVLLVFILQNLDSVAVNIFVWDFELPLGVSMLLAAIAGALVMALVGGVRILQIRRAAKKK